MGNHNVSPTRPGHGVRVAAFFAGGGGLDLGFDQVGFDIVYATDIDKYCVATLNANSGKGLVSTPRVVHADITQIRQADLPPDIDFVIGGPPCQSFSASGRRAGGAAGTLDLRGTLFEAYCRVLGWLQPKGFLFENVRGILATNGGRDWEQIRGAFGQLGYSTTYRVLDALDYGVPQQRERLFLVGHRTERPFLFPEPLYGPDSIEQRPHVIAGEALSGIVETENLDPLYLQNGKYAHLLRLVPHGGNYLFFTAKRGYPSPIFAYRSRFSDFLYKANPNTPVKTIIARPGKYTGPFHWDNRCFSVAEYKRLQGFPDDYQFAGTRDEAIRQIGNSVSPKIANVLARAIAQQLFGRNSGVRLLPEKAVLSFDKRKGDKAKRTRALHEEVRQTGRGTAGTFNFFNYESVTEPHSLRNEKTNTKVTATRDQARIVVKVDGSRKIFAKMRLELYRSDPGPSDESCRSPVKVEVIAYGESEFSVQTMWNAVDEWVIRSSSFHSLYELYGHFTEPHPVFRVVEYKAYSKHPIAEFARHCADFSNCSIHLPRDHLTKLFGLSFKKSNFLDLVETLRGYRFDIRCIETNIAMPPDKYMVAYPFALPTRKQMNFSVRREKKQRSLRERIVPVEV